MKLKHLHLIIGSIAVAVILVAFSLLLIGHPATTMLGVMVCSGLVLVVVLFLGHRQLESVFLQRPYLYGFLSVSSSVLVLVLLVFAAYFSVKWPFRFARILDLSEEHRFTLAPQTKDLLRRLPEPVKVVGLFKVLFRQEEEDMSRAKDLLEMMKVESRGKLTYEFIDPIQQPMRVREFEGEYSTTPALFVVMERKGGESAEAGEVGSLLKEKAEGIKEPDINNALVRLVFPQKARVYFLRGHEERDINDRESISGLGFLKEKLEELQYTVAEHVFGLTYEIPEDCDILAVCGPKQDFTVEELRAVDRFIKKGGRLVVMLEPGVTPDLASQMVRYGFEVGSDIICETKRTGSVGRREEGVLFSTVYTASLNTLVVPPQGFNSAHQITRDFNRQYYFPLCRSVKPTRVPPNGVTVKTLCSTPGGFATKDQSHPVSWAETDVRAAMGAAGDDEKLREIRCDLDRDRMGPISIAAAAEIAIDEFDGGFSKEERSTDQARVVVFGNVEFCSNIMFGKYRQKELAINSFAWGTKREELITAEIASETRNTAIHDPADFRFPAAKGLILATALVLLPFTFIVLGFVNFFWRRMSA